MNCDKRPEVKTVERLYVDGNFYHKDGPLMNLVRFEKR